VRLAMSAKGQKRTRALQQPSKLIRTYDRNTYAAEKEAALDDLDSTCTVAIAQATELM
jgi:hypothetical protein